MVRANKNKAKTPPAEPIVVTAATVEPAPAPTPSTKPLIYERLSMTEYSVDSEHGPLTPNDVVDLMGWQTEEEYIAEQLAAYPESKPEDWAFSDTSPKRKDNDEVQPIHCLDMSGRKVVCWNNANNRLMDEQWQKGLREIVLKGQWAGPLTIPGETVNGETIRISRYAEVLSGQHSMTALKLADELLVQLRSEPMYATFPKYPFWGLDKRPVIETIIITGLSNDERVLQTIDYVKPRDVADMFYTMAIFRSRTPVERKEMTRMLSSAIDTLWVRTRTLGYKTHPEVVGFLERHKKLMDCVEHLFLVNTSAAEDGGRKISKLRIQPGVAAALCYLMGSSGDETDGDEYRNECPPSERNLDWSMWDRACEFWDDLAVDRDFIPVRTKLTDLDKSSPTHPTNKGMGGTLQEKMAVLAKAWEIFKDHPDSSGSAFNKDDIEAGGALCLSYDDKDDKGNDLPDKQIKLLDVADFLGIDSAPMAAKPKVNTREAPDPPPPSREEIARLTEEARARRQEVEDEERAKDKEKPRTPRRITRK